MERVRYTLLPSAPYESLMPEIPFPSESTTLQPEKSDGPDNAVPAVMKGPLQVNCAPSVAGRAVIVNALGNVTVPDAASELQRPVA